MWTYKQSTGQLFKSGGALVATGYSGHGEGKNNPSLQSVHDVGPIPRGTYIIHAPINTEQHGPYVLRLEPFAENEEFGRGGFLMHGDSKEHPGEASLGCIIMPRNVREQVWNSGDAHIVVVA